MMENIKIPNKDNRNSSISVLRVISMMMIVLCHTYHYYTFLPGSNVMALVFSVGVQIFLLISGFLYGGKNVTSFTRFYIGRIEKIALPSILLSVVVLIVKRVRGVIFDYLSILSYCLNLQGILFLNFGFFSKWITEVDVLGPLWFCTIIMISYLFIPLLQRMHETVLLSWHIEYRNMMIIALTSIALCVLYISGFDFTYFCVFICGYFIGHPSYRLEEKICTRIAMRWLATGLCVQVIRLLIRSIADDTPLYSTYVQLSHFVLALSIFVVFLWCGKYFPIIVNRIVRIRLFGKMEEFSFYIYLIHGIFCFGSITNVYARVDNLALATGCFLASTLASAFFLKAVTDRLLKLIQRKI